MKKLLFLMLITLAASFASCEKDPDSGKLDANFVVITDHDANFNFGNYSTFFIAEEIANPADPEGNDTKPWVTEKIQEQILAQFNGLMTKRGFTAVDDKTDADLGIQISFSDNTYAYWNSGGYWNYPGYWGYWGPYWGWGGGFYPGGYWGGFPVLYNFRVGTLIAEIVDLTAKNENKLPVVWSSWMSGMLYNSKFNEAAAEDAIQQSFDQSPYIKNK